MKKLWNAKNWLRTHSASSLVPSLIVRKPPEWTPCRFVYSTKAKVSDQRHFPLVCQTSMMKKITYIKEFLRLHIMKWIVLLIK